MYILWYIVSIIITQEEEILSQSWIKLATWDHDMSKYQLEILARH